MEFNWFTRAVARVVLASYVKQVFGPVVYAMEVERHPGRFGVGQPGLRDPSPPREKILQRSLQQTLESELRSKLLASPTQQDFEKTRSILQNFSNGTQTNTSEKYQYRLRVKTLRSKDEGFLLKLSRKDKRSLG